MKEVALKEVAPAEPAKQIPQKDKLWLLTLDQIESGTGNIIDPKYGPLAEAGGSTLFFDTGNVLYSKLRPYLNKVICPDEPGIATTELVPLRPSPEVLDRKYLCYYLRSNRFVSWVSSQVAGAKMPRVSMKVLWEHKIPLPPLPEQKCIAAILDKADAIRRKRQQSIQLLDDLLKSTFLDMFGDPVTNPKGWELGTIRDLLDEAKYGTSEKAHVEPTDEPREYPVLRMNNITYQGICDFSDLKYVVLAEKDIPKHTVKKGDVLFNRTNSKELVGKTAVFPLDQRVAYAGYLVRARTNARAMPEYLAAYLNSDYGKAVLRGMCKNIIGMANINAQEFQDIKIPIPPIKFQREFVQFSNSVESHRATTKAAIGDAHQLAASLSQKAFNGEL